MVKEYTKHKIGKSEQKRIERRNIIIKLMDKGFSQSDIARVIGVSRQRINQILNPDKHLARQAVGYDIRNGHTTKPSSCQKCKLEMNKLEAHHPDHTDRRNIMWLCSSCHVSEDNKGWQHRR